MASLAALTPNDPAFQPGFDDADTSVAAAISLYGYLGASEGRDPESSPQAHVRSRHVFALVRVHRPRLRSEATQHLHQPGRLRRATRRSALVRHLSFDPL